MIDTVIWKACIFLVLNSALTEVAQITSDEEANSINAGAKDTLAMAGVCRGQRLSHRLQIRK